jgi:hypothetical protein
MINVCIGYDGREAAAFNVLAYSIHRRSSQPVSIAPLMLSQLQGVFRRERHPLQSTDFSFSRFLTPWLADYAGWSISWTATCWCSMTSQSCGRCATTATR